MLAALETTIQDYLDWTRLDETAANKEPGASTAQWSNRGSGNDSDRAGCA